jgi:hypothetical protein
MVELHAVDGIDGSLAETGVDVDADVGFFEMSLASAEQVTLQIRSMMERAWDYIAIAYQGRAHIALGYESWDEYVDARLGDLRLTVPREERGAAVQSLSRAQMSLRAIAKVLGVNVATVHRALGIIDRTDQADGDDAEESASIRGRDGKKYPRRQRPKVTVCSICGEVHDGDSDECPWDLFAQGVGPRPGPDSSPQGGNDQAAQLAPQGNAAIEPSVGAVTSIADAVVRASCLLDELGTLPDLVHEIEDLGRPDVEPGRQVLLADLVRALLSDLRAQVALLPDLVRRLERAAHQLVAGRP